MNSKDSELVKVKLEKNYPSSSSSSSKERYEEDFQPIDQSEKNIVSYEVTAVDPGITDGAIVKYDIITKRLKSAAPFSLRPFIPEGDKRITNNNAPCAVIKLIKDEKYAHLFAPSNGVGSDPVVFVEGQMKQPLNTVQSVFQTHFHGRVVLSSPASVRAHYGIRVDAREAGHDKKAAYLLRKELSEAIALDIIHRDDLDKLRVIADSYWKNSPQYTPAIRRKKSSKCFNDLVEASLIALYPGNWKKASTLSPMPAPAILSMELELKKANDIKLELSRKKRAYSKAEGEKQRTFQRTQASSSSSSSSSSSTKYAPFNRNSNERSSSNYSAVHNSIPQSRRPLSPRSETRYINVKHESGRNVEYRESPSELSRRYRRSPVDPRRPLPRPIVRAKETKRNNYSPVRRFRLA